MTQRFTRYSHTPIPPNPFVDAVSPDNWDNPNFRAALARPDLASLIDAEVHQGHITPGQAKGLLRDLRQHKRALNGDRELPGELTGDPNHQHLPLPFTPRAEHPEDRRPGSEKYAVMRGAVERLDAGFMQQALTRQMASHDPPGTHAAATDTPSLHDSIQASVDALGG